MPQSVTLVGLLGADSVEYIPSHKCSRYDVVDGKDCACLERNDMKHCMTQSMNYVCHCSVFPAESRKMPSQAIDIVPRIVPCARLAFS